MTALIEKIASQGGATRSSSAKATAKPKPGRPKHSSFAYRPPTKAFNLQAQLHQEPRVEREEIIDALEAIIKELRAAR